MRPRPPTPDPRPRPRPSPSPVSSILLSPPETERAEGSVSPSGQSQQPETNRGHPGSRLPLPGRPAVAFFRAQRGLAILPTSATWARLKRSWGWHVATDLRMAPRNHPECGGLCGFEEWPKVQPGERGPRSGPICMLCCLNGENARVGEVISYARTPSHL